MTQPTVNGDECVFCRRSRCVCNPCPHGVADPQACAECVLNRARSLTLENEALLIQRARHWEPRYLTPRPPGAVAGEPPTATGEPKR